MAGAGVIVAALVVTGWLGLSAQRASAVHVLLPVDALSCDGTTVSVSHVASAHGDDVATLVAEITEEMRCRLEFLIENRSSSDVAIQQVSLPVLGPRGGPGIEAVALDLVALEPRADQLDAIFDLEQTFTIPAGSSEAFGVILEWRPDGCTGEGTIISFPDQPTVRIGVLGRDHDRSVTGSGFGFRGSSASNCD